MSVGFYVPPAELAIDKSVQLSTEYDAEVETITYEVIRHNLWNVNDEHGLTMANVSGSPIAAYAHDFNPCILTESGEFVYFGPFIQFFAGMTDLVVKWILENRSANPGIHEGDMFLSNDPLIGTHHQSDVFLVAPIFWEGKIFCWVANALHQYDIGGNTPGSFCVDAKDIFDEPVPIPPIKIVERGELRRDIAEMYLRHSRLPDILGLDLRAQIAGINVATSRIRGLIDRYNARLVKSVMQRIIADSEAVFVQKLAAIPDGEWQARGYMEASTPGDRRLYQARMRLRKRGDQLIFDNAGTDAQVGTLSTTFAGWRGAIMSVLNPFFCHEVLYAIGGAIRHLHFEPQAGTILSSVHPAATSCAPAFGTQAAIDLTHECLVKMLETAPSLREAIAAPGGHSQTAITTVWGTDQRGRQFGTILTDHMLGSIGAFTFRDGISTGGLYWDIQSTAPNVEFNEQHYPILYLYRRESPDSAGAGRFRGGNAAELAFVPHGTDVVNQVLIGAGLAMPGAAGLEGGGPGGTSAYRLVRGSNVQQLLESGKLPQSLDGLSGEHVNPGAKTRFVQTIDDVFEMRFSASGGYGDPIERDPKLILEDVRSGSITEAAARSLYGVALRATGIDVDATELLRNAELDRRAGPSSRKTPAVKLQGPVLAELSESVHIVSAGGTSMALCARCRTVIGPSDSNFKLGCIREDRPLMAANSVIADPSELLDDVIQFRCFYCPGCHRRLATEVARATDEVMLDATITHGKVDG